MVTSQQPRPIIGFGIVSFILLIAFLYIGFFGGEQRLIDAYPAHEGGIHFAADVIRIAFWVILILIIIVIVIGIAAAAIATSR